MYPTAVCLHPGETPTSSPLCFFSVAAPRFALAVQLNFSCAVSHVVRALSKAKPNVCRVVGVLSVLLLESPSPSRPLSREATC